MRSKKTTWQALLLGLLCVTLGWPVLEVATLWSQDSRPADPPATEPKADPPTSKPAKPRPELGTVIDNMIEAAGGKKLSTIKSQIIKGSMAMPAMNIEGAMVTYFRAPHFVHSSIDLGAMGKIESGYDGVTAWMRDINMGPRILTEDEKQQNIDQSLPDMMLHVREKYPQQSLGSDESVNGRPCYALVLVGPDGKQETWLVDQEDWIVRRRKFVSKTPMGEIPVEADLLDYQEHGGIPMAMETRVKIPAMGFEQVLKFTDVQMDVEIGDDHFALPADIQALVDKAKEKEAGGTPSGPAGGGGEPTSRPKDL